MDAKEKVLATMKEASQPLNAGKIAELSGLDRKVVDAAMKQLKAEEQSSLLFVANGHLQSDGTGLDNILCMDRRVM